MTLDDNYLKYQNDGEKDDDFGNNAEEGPNFCRKIPYFHSYLFT